MQQDTRATFTKNLIMKNFKKLYVWTKAMDFAIIVYKLTFSFPPDERFGMSSQMKRSAVSIPSNISEGCGRRTTADQARFIDIALGSSFELETQILLSKNLGFITEEEADKALNEVAFIQVALSNYLSKLRSNSIKIQTAGIVTILLAIGWGVLR
jgi:four helix bundle protein